MKPLSYVTPDHLLQRLLAKEWFPRRAVVGKKPWRIGVCVSGGPDSMALAYLLRHMPHPDDGNINAFSPWAFIIDHGARDGSNQEALWVKRQLRTMNIQTQVMKLRWPDGVDPKSMSGFEDAARTGRYRALVDLAARHRLYDLFTGHHLDDQIETVMLRMVRDKSLNPLSLRGMAVTAPVPTSEESRKMTSRTLPYQPPESPLEGGDSISRWQSEEYRAGIRIHRVLLEYQKQQLINTCEHFQIPYVLDKTNFDPSVTVRNAIRHLRRRHDLPKALSGPRILALSAWAEESVSIIESSARSFFKYVASFNLHSRTGVLLLRLNSLPRSMSKSQMREFSMFLRKILSVVSPSFSKNSTLLDQNATEQLYTWIMGSTVGGPARKHTLVTHEVACTQMPYDSSLGTFPIQFSRQALSSREVQILRQQFVPYEDMDIPSTRSHPILWDSRFWILLNGSQAAITDTVVECYSVHYAVEAKRKLKARGLLERFEHELSICAPGKSRFTLPVLVTAGELVAFPSLNIAITPNPPISWQVSYARNLKTMEFFFPGIREKDRISWAIGEPQGCGSL